MGMNATERLKFILTADVEGAIKGFEKTGEAAEHNLKKAEGGTARLSGQMTKMGAGAIVAAGIVGVALFEVAKKWEEAALAAGKLSKQTGLTVEEASRWSVVAKGADVDTEVLAKSLGKMDKAIEATPEKFRNLGAEIAKTSSGAVDVSATFLNVIQRLNDTGGMAAHAAEATALFGKGWQGMAEITGKSADELKGRLEAVSKAQVFDEKQVAAAEKYRDSMKSLSNAVQGLVMDIGKSAAPVISDMASGLAGMVSWVGKADDATGGLAGKFLTIATVGVGAAGAMSVIAGQALKMRNTLMPMGEDGSRALSGVGKAAIGAGILIAGFAVITELMGEKAKHAKDEVKDLDARMRSLGLTVEEAAKQKVTEFVNKGGDLADMMKKAGLSSDDLRHAIVSGSDAMQAFKDRLTEAAVAQATSSRGMNGAVGHVTALTTELWAQQTAYESVVGSTKETDKATAELGKTTKDLEHEQKDAAKTADDMSKALDDERKRLVDLANEQLAAIDKTYAYAQAQRDTRQAVIDMTATLGDSTISQDDQANAVEKARLAIEAQALAYANSRGDVAGSTTQVNDMINSLTIQAATLDPKSPLYIALQGYILKLKDIPANIDTLVNFHSGGNLAVPDGGPGQSNAADQFAGGMYQNTGPNTHAPGYYAPNGPVVNNYNTFNGVTDTGALAKKIAAETGWALRVR